MPTDSTQSANALAQPDDSRQSTAGLLAGLSPANPWRAATMVLKGAAELLDGQLDPADVVLAEAVETGRDTGALPAAATALAERCLVAIGRDDWAEAESLSEQVLEVLAAGRLEDYVMSPLVHAVVARTALHRGDVPGAREHLARAARLAAVAHLRDPLGRGADAAGAGAGLPGPGRRRPAPRPSCGRPGTSCGCDPTSASCPPRSRTSGRGWTGLAGPSPGASSLSTAELWLLLLLATHLFFREIGQRLHLSKHTVKTHAMSIYRKLGASSRSQAVQRVHDLGLLAR